MESAESGADLEIKKGGEEEFPSSQNSISAGGLGSPDFAFLLP